MTTYSTVPRLNHCCENILALLGNCQTTPRTVDELIFQAALRKMPPSAEQWANLSRLCWEESVRLMATETATAVSMPSQALRPKEEHAT